MAYTNSPLVSYTRLSPNHSGLRTHPIDRITPHCVVGQCSVETLGDIFYPSSRDASCQYGIGADGRVGMYVEEKNRSWCSSSNENDQRAVTIECASDTTPPYAFRNVVYKKLILLCVDICKRNGKTKLLWLGSKEKALAYSPKSDEMILTAHRWFENKSCPGDWLYSRYGDLAKQVTALLKGSAITPSVATENIISLYRVQVGAYKNPSNARRMAESMKAKGFDTLLIKSGSLYKVQSGAFSKKANAENLKDRLKSSGFDVIIIGGTSAENSTSKTEAFVPYRVKVETSVLNVRKEPTIDSAITTQITDFGVYTIVEESTGAGATKWGKLKSGTGWISLDYADKL